LTVTTENPSFSDLVRVFTRIGCLSFGGPAGQIALMHKELVEDRQWVGEEQYLHALNFCHLLPGPEAQQLATWIGWRLHGIKGGLAAGLLFVIPGALGILVAALRPEWLKLKPVATDAITSPKPWGASLKAVIVWAVIWAAPMIAVFATVGPEHVLWDIGTFFSQLAVVTFGGAYAVLAYMAQEAVQGFGWLSAGEMADGLGLAETTPGPLFMVTQYVGYLAAFRAPEPFTPLVAGIIGATLTAAVVGVTANLSVWFILHVIFRTVGETAVGPVRLYVPEWASFDWRAAVLAVIALVLVFRFNWNVIKVLGFAALGGLALGQLG
jgi:chromate transporter